MILTFENLATEELLRVEAPLGNFDIDEIRTFAKEAMTEGGESTLTFLGDENELFECGIDSPTMLDDIIKLYSADCENTFWNNYVEGDLDNISVIADILRREEIHSLQEAVLFSQLYYQGSVEGSDAEELGMNDFSEVYGEIYNELEEYGLLDLFDFAGYWKKLEVDYNCMIDTGEKVYLF